MARLNLISLRDQKRGVTNRKAVKTFLTEEAHDRIKASAEYTGMFEYEIVEQAIMEALPPASELFEEPEE